MNPDDRPIPSDDDRALKEALAEAPHGVDAARIEALQRRVMAQWQDAHRVPTVGGGAAAWLAGFGARRSWVVGATGLALGMAVVLGTWLRPADPALDELLQPDVLSQMAAGEM